MHSLRSPRSTYLAAFLLGGLIALLLARPGRAAEPFQLDRVGIVRFSELPAGKLSRQTGVLDVRGQLQLRPGTSIDRPANMPAEALNRPLVSVTAWSAYYALGFGALQGFMLEEGAVTFVIGDESFKAVAPNPDAPLYDGRPVNLSTRAVLRHGIDQIVAGFVIEDRPRLVLLRVAGPSLAPYGVPYPAPDPFVTLRQNGQEIATNNDWSAQPDAALVARAITRAGAFPFPPGSRDAALVVLLPPGIYTAHASAAGPSLVPGEVMVEVYTLPAEIMFADETSTAN